MSRGHQAKKVVSILELDRQIATTTAGAAADADAGANADDDPDPNAGLDPRPRRGTTDKYRASSSTVEMFDARRDATHTSPN